VTQSFTIGQASQTITFGALVNTTYGDPAFSISATASSGLAVAYTTSTPASCGVHGSIVILLATGTCTITADQAGNANYIPAPHVARSFTVVPASSVPQFELYIAFVRR
jgi:hypothetical protein